MPAIQCWKLTRASLKGKPNLFIKGVGVVVRPRSYLEVASFGFDLTSVISRLVLLLLDRPEPANSPTGQAELDINHLDSVI